MSIYPWGNGIFLLIANVLMRIKEWQVQVYTFWQHPVSRYVMLLIES